MAAAADGHRLDSRPGAGVELVLEDDRGGLAVDPGPVGVTLGRRRRTTGPAPLHGTEPFLGKMAGQALIAERDRQAHKG